MYKLWNTLCSSSYTCSLSQPVIAYLRKRIVKFGALSANGREYGCFSPLHCFVTVYLRRQLHGHCSLNAASWIFSVFEDKIRLLVVGCVLPFLVYVPLKKTASNHRVVFRGKWTQMIERLFYEQSERVKEKCWEDICQTLDIQRLNDLCRLLKIQTGC